MSTSPKKKTTRKRLKAGSRRMKGSTRPYTRHSGMTVTNVVASAAGNQVFTKVTSGIGDVGTEQDLFRLLTNTSTTLTIQLGQTQAQAIGANGYKLGPGKDFVLAGPAGAGWLGDVWVFEATGVAVASLMQF